MSRLALAIRVDDEIELRLNELRYAEAYHELIIRNLDHLRTWMPWAALEQTIESTRTHIREVMHQLRYGTEESSLARLDFLE